MGNDKGYKGYKDYRSFLNAKLHALSIKICGDKSVLNYEIDRELLFRVPNSAMFPLPPPSVTLLTIDEAKRIYDKLLLTLKELKSEDKNKVMSIGQRKAIIKITKYDFEWSPEATFSFILGVLPEKRKRMSVWEVQNSKLQKLYMILSKADADKVIKRLDKIKKRNLVTKP